MVEGISLGLSIAAVVGLFLIWRDMQDHWEHTDKKCDQRWDRDHAAAGMSGQNGSDG